MTRFDLARQSLRALNAALHELSPSSASQSWAIANPAGKHGVAVGVNAPAHINIEGHVGYYCAAMNQLARIGIHGSAGVGVAENMMSGEVRVRGDASQAAGAAGRGGLLVIEGNAGARCGISIKGVDIVVAGDVGHLSAFMAQAGALVVLGDAGDALGDSIYEARLYVQGKVKSLGADCIEKPMRAQHLAQLKALLDRAGLAKADAARFKRYGSARALYNFHVDNMGAY